MSEREHIIVVGSGIAGLVAALELCQRYAVTLVTKSELAESNTRWAQGGIAAVMFDDDSVAEHIADTLRAGAGLCDAAAVEILCTEGPARIRELIRLGVAFDHREGLLARGLEAAHSKPRVLHAGGDATGLTIETALVRAVRAAENIRVLEHTFACDLVMQSDCVAGLEVLLPSGQRERLAADAVILASGGAGQLFLHTTNPAVATGDGVAMALRAGAQLADLEFYQFHPTALSAPGNFLISEAVRGEGAVLLDNRGRRFMQAIHSDAELAPRDVVSRGIAMQMAAQDGAPVLLDASMLAAKHGAGFLSNRFPTIDAACRARGLDWANEPIPVTPAAHYWMGGIRSDTFGRTSLRGLFAIGEVARTGVHGANRLASNSLLESLVFAWRCAHLLLVSPADTVEAFTTDLQAEGSLDLAQVFEQDCHGTAVDRRTLQRLMWKRAGIERDRAGLLDAQKQLNRWHAVGETPEALETRNLLVLAGALVASALAREESRGAHFRNDFPEPRETFRRSLLYAQKVAVSC